MRRWLASLLLLPLLAARLAAAWQRTPSPSGTPYTAAAPPLEVIVPGSVFNAFVGLFNLWPAPVEGPPPGGAVPLRRLHTEGGDDVSPSERDDAELDGALARMSAHAVAQEALHGPVGEQHGLTFRLPTLELGAGVGSATHHYTHGAGRRLASEPRPEAAHRARRAASATLPDALRAAMRAPPAARAAVYDTNHPGRGRALQSALGYGDRRVDLYTRAGRDELFLDGYLSCWLPPTRVCVLQRLAASNSTGGVPVSRLAPCCAERRLVRGGLADPATLFDVPPELFNPGCQCGHGSGGGGGGAPPAGLSDEEVWGRVQAAWFAYASECEYLDSTELASVPTTELWVPEWCALARWQPHVLATYGLLEPVTVLLPTHGAFERLADRFPSFWLWLTALPSCRGGFNRAEYFLRLHSTPCDFTCTRLGAYDRATATARSLVALGRSESLTLGRIMPPGTALDNASCLVGNADIFVYPRTRGLYWQDDRFVFEHDEAARVLAEFRGTDGGNLLVIDRVRVGGWVGCLQRAD